jgi:hypothetical protein
MLSDSENDNKIHVGSDGVKLGWNVLAILASLGLGLYVSSIVSPLETEIRRTENNYKKELSVLEKELAEAKATYSSHIDKAEAIAHESANNHSFLSQKVIGIETSVNYMAADLARVQRLTDEQIRLRYRWDTNLQAPSLTDKP